jgi:predicted acetyltransferase
MKIQLERVEARDKPVLRRLLELYLYDFSEYDQADVSEHGLYEYEYLDHYWTEHGRFAYFLRVNGRLAGFALVRDREVEGRLVHGLAEFFVLRKYRRQGTGSRFARRLFDLFPGRWQVAQEEANRPSQLFWRRVIGEYTYGQFTEISLPDWHGPVQEFTSPGQPGGEAGGE